MNSVNNLASQPARSTWVTSALEQILRPIIHIFLKNFRVTCPIFEEIVRNVYVDIAIEDAIQIDPTSKASVSYVSYLTGLSAHFVKQIWRKLETRGARPGAVSVQNLAPEAKLLDIWATQPMWHDQDGKPKVLPIQPPHKGERSFVSLIRHTLGNAGHTDLLRSLIFAGCVETQYREDGRQAVRLINQFYTPPGENLQAAVDATAKAIRHFMQTFSFNLANPELAPMNNMFQQERWSRVLSKKDLPEFRENVRALLRKQVSDIEPQLEKLEEGKGPMTAQSIHAGVGYYYFEDATWQRYESLAVGA